MADVFRLQGGWVAGASNAALSGTPQVDAQFAPVMAIDGKCEVEYTLSADSAQSISFAGLDEANVVIVVSDSKVRLRLTSSDGSQQSVPCDGLFVLVSETVAVTALDATRVAGQSTSVKVFLAKRA